MKNSWQLLVFLFLSVGLISCSKTKSSDPPFPPERKAAVYITTNNNNLISYDPVNGKKNWEVFLNGPSDGVPLLIGTELFLVTRTGVLHRIDVKTGNLVFSKNLLSACRLSMATDGAYLYVASVDSLYCYDGSGNWRWTFRPGGAYACTSSPQVVNGRVYLGINDRLYCIDASNGNGIWSSFTLGSDILSSPRVSNGLVYFGSQNRKIYALNASDGSVKWEYTTGDKITTSSPLVYGGMCIIGSQDYGIYCVDSTSPTSPAAQLRWEYPAGDRVNSSAAVHEPSNTILIGSHDYNLYAINHVDGLLKWKYPAGSIIQSSPTVYGERVYFTAMDRYLYCIDVRNGATLWKAFMNGTSESSPLVDDLQTGIYPGISGMSRY